MINLFWNWILNNTPLLYWTQSLWRDEAFSVWIARDSISEVIRRTSGDFNPPLYYFLLHLWMQIFGRSEIALRSLSLIAFVLLLITVYFFSKKIFKSEKWGIYTVFLTAFNPMLVYFAFELRMYSLFALFAALSMYFLYTENKTLYVIFSVLGLYTQPFMAILLIAQIIYLILNKNYKFLIQNFILITLLYLPWLPTLLAQFKASGPMWMWPINFNLVLAVLGNLYFGYEGTPGNLWTIMQIFSLILTIGSVWAYKRTLEKNRYRLMFLLIWVLVPLILVLGISVLKPIYVLRYIIFVTVGEVLTVVYIISQVKPLTGKKLIAYAVLFITFASNFAIASSFHKKVDIRSTFTQINQVLKPDDIIAAQTPLVYYESAYYSAPNFPVFLYNPQRLTPPRYTGSIGMPPSVWLQDYPEYPKRVFMIQEDGSYIIKSRQ